MKVWTSFTRLIEPLDQLQFSSQGHLSEGYVMPYLHPNRHKLEPKIL
jgi:hypothetical protein